MKQKQIAQQLIASANKQCECCGKEIKKGEKCYEEITPNIAPWLLCEECISEGDFEIKK